VNNVGSKALFNPVFIIIASTWVFLRVIVKHIKDLNIRSIVTHDFYYPNNVKFWVHTDLSIKISILGPFTEIPRTDIQGQILVDTDITIRIQALPHTTMKIIHTVKTVSRGSKQSCNKSVKWDKMYLTVANYEFTFLGILVY
jgi:hypothetical protein